MPLKMCFFKTCKNTTRFISFKSKISIWIHLEFNPYKPALLCTETNIHHNISWSLLFPGSLKRYILLTLDCGRCSRVGSGAFGVSSVSAFSVTTRVGGGTGTLSRAGTQGREGGWHTLVVIHPNKPGRKI